MRLLHTGLLSLLILGFAVASSRAVEIATPSTFFDYTIETGPTVDPDDFYYLSPSAVPAGDGPTKSFLMVFDGSGALRYWDFGSKTNFFPIEHTGEFAWAEGRAGEPDVFRVVDENWNTVEEISPEHPVRPAWWMDGHELLFQEDGTRWTLWWETRTYDMGDYLPGGQEDVLVYGHVVQHWDANGDILWSWRSLDHLDDLSFTARPDSSDLYQGSFEHLHVNSIEVTDEAVYLSCRYMSLVVKIDRATALVDWRLGTGPGNDFTFSTDLDFGGPLDFNFQHDARVTDDGHITVFDNGLGHVPSTSYAREYAIDEDSLTAELVWVHTTDPPVFGRITGTHRKLDNGNHLIGWGNRYPEIAATEVTEDGELVWQISFAVDNEINRRPATYRIYKSRHFSATERPTLHHRVEGNAGEVELLCNWFGMEHKLGAYHLYRGFEPDNLQFFGASETGVFYDSTPVSLHPYYYQVRAIDFNGDEVDLRSDIYEIAFAESGIRVHPLTSTDLPLEGGTLYFATQITNASPDFWNNAVFRTYVQRPNGNEYGPIIENTFSLAPYSAIISGNLSQVVPGWVEGGDFEFIVEAQVDDDTGYRDAFPFTKEGDPGLAAVAVEHPWPVGSPLTIDPASDPAEPSTLPETLVLTGLYPNPFNGTARVTVQLPAAGRLRVDVVNPLGRTVAELADGPASAGRHEFAVNGTRWASGLYIVRAQVDGGPVRAGKLLLVR